ncbi:MAG: hypothetical protein HFG51_05945 [Lachnospiraceae bacterium]|nr:hypothetical protein [Lachnospiraceae bacterium]
MTEKKSVSDWKLSKWKLPELTGRMLKLLALVSMVADHIGVIIVEQRLLNRRVSSFALPLAFGLSWKQWFYADRFLRCIGRLAFPIYLYFLVEGFLRTRNKKAYGIRLFLFALLSEIPFDYAIFGQWYYPAYQNVIFTLCIAFLTLCAMHKYRHRTGLLFVFPTIGAMMASVLHVDYGAVGVLMAVILYVYRGSRQQLVAGAAIAALESLSLYGTAALSFFLIRAYCGNEGKWPGKYFFYFAYPGHLLLLAWIGRLI